MSFTDHKIFSSGSQFDSTFPRTEQCPQNPFDRGNSCKPASTYGLGSPVSPASDFMSTSGSPVMASFEPTAAIHSGNNFLSASTSALFDHDLYPLQPQPETQYGTMKPAWMFDGQQLPWLNEDATTATPAPELTQLDTQLPQQCRPMFGTQHGQITPPEDIALSKDGSGTATSPSTSTDDQQMSTATHRINSTLPQSADEANIASTKPRRQRKAHARRESASATLDFEEDENREAYLARNRIAARKCREKKKKRTDGLEKKERNLRLENQALQAHKAALTNELLLLKNKALDHKDCKCDRVREYLVISAREKIEEIRTEEVGAHTSTKEEAVNIPEGHPLARRLSDASEPTGQIGQLVHSRSNSLALRCLKVLQDCESISYN